jgi:hypothetical protein
MHPSERKTKQQQMLTAAFDFSSPHLRWRYQICFYKLQAAPCLILKKIELILLSFKK